MQSYYISSVELSKIAGYRYPSNEIEKKKLISLFSSSREVAVGDIICTSCDTVASTSNESDGIGARDNSGLNYYYVKVITLSSEIPPSHPAYSIHGEGKKSNDEDRSRISIHGDHESSSRVVSVGERQTSPKARTLKGKTTIILNGRTNHIICTSIKMRSCEDIESSSDMTVNDSCEHEDKSPYSREPFNIFLSSSILDLCDVYQNTINLALAGRSKLEQQYNGMSSSKHGSMTVQRHSITDSNLFGLLTSPLLIECSSGEEGRPFSMIFFYCLFVTIKYYHYILFRTTGYLQRCNFTMRKIECIFFQSLQI